MRSTLLVVLSVYHRMMWRVKVAADIRWLGESANPLSHQNDASQNFNELYHILQMLMHWHTQLMKHSDWSHTPYTTAWKKIQPTKSCSTWTSLLEFHGLLLEVVTFRLLPAVEMVTSASSSPSPPLPEWGKHMARSPETFSELTFFLIFSVPLPTSYVGGKIFFWDRQL